jgi:hypothetical protein
MCQTLFRTGKLLELEGLMETTAQPGHCDAAPQPGRPAGGGVQGAQPAGAQQGAPAAQDHRQPGAPPACTAAARDVLDPTVGHERVVCWVHVCIMHCRQIAQGSAANWHAYG